MKKLLFFLFALLAYVGNAKADVVVQPVNDALSVGDNNIVELKEGKEGVIYVNVTPKGRIFRDCEFDIILPVGIDAVKVGDAIKAIISEDQPINELDNSKRYAVRAESNANNPRYITFVISCSSGAFPLNDGVLLELYVKPNETLKAGKQLTATMTGTDNRILISSGDNGINGYSQTAFDFTIKIVEDLIVFKDTESYEDFEPAENSNVQVIRAVKANTWNTICLPFAMSADQIARVFGSDAKVADFTGCEREINDDEEVIGIKSTFEIVSNMEGHHPYLLKVSDDFAKTVEGGGFTVNGVSVVKIPDDGAWVEVDYKVGKKTKENYFVGLYSPTDNLLNENGDPVVFISNNNFYIANGSTKMKGFRGYFEFAELAEYMNYKGYQSNLSFFIDGEEVTDGIEGVNVNYQVIDGVYDLQGRLLKVENNDINSLKKGIYIINGKKVTVK